MSKPRIECIPNGPLKTEGLMSVSDAKGSVEIPSKAFLCRCGGSKNKPFCDGTHGKIGFSTEKETDRTPDKLDEYQAEGISVSDNRGICAHAGFCTAGLPTAFRMKEEPFVDASGGSPEEIANTIKKCPSGALRYSVHGQNGGAKETGVFIAPNGPYVISGEVELEGVQWLEGASKTQFTLCRCGASKNKPFCNGAHWNTKFDENANASI